MATVKKTEEKKVVTKPAAVKKAAPAKTETVVAASKAEKVTAKVAKTVTIDLSLDILDLNGKATGKITLPAEIFGEVINKQLLHQAIRVYQANKRQGNASTLTRGEVDGSTKKIYRQKGTGRARHGSLRAPIFVKGGIVHGPKPRDYSLDLPKKMRRKALFSALSSKVLNKEITVLSGVESIEPKTKLFVAGLKQLGFEKTKNILLVTAADHDNVKRAVSNIGEVSITAANRLNALAVLKARRILFTKDAVEAMQKAVTKE